MGADNCPKRCKICYDGGKCAYAKLIERRDKKEREAFEKDVARGRHKPRVPKIEKRPY